MSYGYNVYGGDLGPVAKYTGYAYGLSIIAILIIVFLVPSFGVGYDEKYQLAALKFAVIFMVVFGAIHGYTGEKIPQLFGLK